MKNENNILKEIGLRIRGRRLMLGLSQEELGWQCDLHRTYIGMLERGEKNLTVSSMVRICAGLKIKISELLVGIEDYG